MADLHALYIDSIEENCATIERLICGIGDIPTKADNQKHVLTLLADEKYDYFVLDLNLSLTEEDEPDFENGLGLIDQIRNYYPRSLEYPIILFSNTIIDNDQLVDCMESGANSFLPFKPNNHEDKKALRKTIKRLANKALFKRNYQMPHTGSRSEVNIELTLKKLGLRHKLVVDLKSMEVLYNGIKFPSGKNGLQPRHKVFLFILAKNLGTAMSSDEIQEQIRKLKLDEFNDSAGNLRNRIRTSLKEMANNNPEKISKNETKAFLKTVPYGLTRMTLEASEVYLINGNEDYPLL